MNIKVGDKVRWTSSGTPKTGVVVKVLPAGCHPAEEARNHFPNHRQMFDGWTTPGRGDAYLIEAPGGKTAKAKPKLYMPYPKQIEVVR